MPKLVVLAVRFFGWMLVALAISKPSTCQALQLGCYMPLRLSSDGASPFNRPWGVQNDIHSRPFSRSLHHLPTMGANHDGSDVEDEASATARSICVILNPGGNYEDISQGIARNLTLPRRSEEMTVDDGSLMYRHGLVVVPYQYRDLSTYAIAIQNLHATEASTSRYRKRRSNLRKATELPLFVDFCPPPDSRQGRRYGGQSGTDLLLKAVGPVKKGQGQVVCDLTAGFGQDSILLAKGGASSVHMVERDPVVALLLQDALRRLALLASSGEVSAMDLSQKLSLQVGDGVHVAKELSTSQEVGSVSAPDVCYLDPMFPPRTKSAAVKKNMQMLHSLLNSQSMDDNSDGSLAEAELLEAAFRAAKLRVVVKRPISAAPLGGFNHDRKPTYDIRGSANRWDVYMKQQRCRRTCMS